MALFLEQTTKGITINYWVVSNIVWDKLLNRTSFDITPYLNAETRTAGVENALWDLREQHTFDGYYDLAGCYEKLKEPVYIDVPTLDENKKPMFDEAGNPITHQVNINKWVDAIDLI